jgi:hypothetical protein
MANAAGGSATAQQGQGTAGQSGSASANPFWEVTNFFSQANKSGVTSATLLGSNTVAGGSNINPGNFLRGIRLLVRTSTVGANQLTQSSSTFTANGQASDYPFNLFQNLGMLNVDGSEILYNVIGGYAWAQAHRFGRPWLQDPTTAYDFCASPIAPSFTLFLQPEVRQQLGALENTDTRSQYNWTQTLNSTTNIYNVVPTTAPTVTVTPYVDMWAQPDSTDLEQVPNQQVPNGVNLQTKTRHQTYTLNSAGSDNFILSSLTGNAIRWMILIVRDSNLARQDFLTTNVQWQLDQRNLSTFATDNIFQLSEDFYRGYGGVSRPCGVYVFPRFYAPGNLYGSGWLYTANSTALSWESNTNSSAGSNLPGTIELLQEEIYATGPVDPSLIDL